MVFDLVCFVQRDGIGRQAGSSRIDRPGPASIDARTVHREVSDRAIGERMMKRWGIVPILPDILLAVATVIIPVLLLALAYASPPDPAWIPGVYDDADGDDVIVQVTSAMGNVPSDLPLDTRPTPASADSLPPIIDEVFVSFSPFASHSRAPPRS